VDVDRYDWLLATSAGSSDISTNRDNPSPGRYPDGHLSSISLENASIIGEKNSDQPARPETAHTPASYFSISPKVISGEKLTLKSDLPLPFRSI